MFDIQFHSNHDLEPLKHILPKDDYYRGVVYAISWGSGKVKIGKTRRPYGRISSLISYATSYADVEVTRIIVSDIHTNYSNNEKTLHKQFAEQRVGGEIFTVDINTIQQAMTQLEYRDDSKSLSLKSEEASESLKKALYPNISNDAYNEALEEIVNYVVDTVINLKTKPTTAVLLQEIISNFTDLAFNLTGEEISQMLTHYIYTLPPNCDSIKLFSNATNELNSKRKYRIFILSLDSDNNESDTDSTEDEWLVCYAGNDPSLSKQRDELPDEVWD